MKGYVDGGFRHNLDVHNHNFLINTKRSQGGFKAVVGMLALSVDVCVDWTFLSQDSDARRVIRFVAHFSLSTWDGLHIQRAFNAGCVDIARQDQ